MRYKTRKKHAKHAKNTFSTTKKTRDYACVSLNSFVYSYIRTLKNNKMDCTEKNWIELYTKQGKLKTFIALDKVIAIMQGGEDDDGTEYWLIETTGTSNEGYGFETYKNPLESIVKSTIGSNYISKF